MRIIDKLKDWFRQVTNGKGVVRLASDRMFLITIEEISRKPYAEYHSCLEKTDIEIRNEGKAFLRFKEG